MLDVHPPHEKVHSWTDFFLHIATIVVGLLIAVGLEQLVELVHRHYELNETRESLALEMEGNKAKLASNERNWLYTYALLKNDLQVLRYVRDHPGTPQASLPGALKWLEYPFLWDHAVWDAAVNKGVDRSMPLEEANRRKEFYLLMAAMETQSLDGWNAINDARRFDLLDPDPSHLSPAELSEVIQRTEIAMSKHMEFGYSFGRYAKEFPDLPHSLTYDRLAELRPADQDDPQLADARQRSREQIDAVLTHFGMKPQARE